MLTNHLLISFFTTILFFTYGCTPPPEGAAYPLAEEITFTYTAAPSVISNQVVPEGFELKPASNDTNVLNYKIFWADTFGNAKGQITSIAATHDGKHMVYDFPDNAVLPNGTVYILACSEGAEGLYCGASGVKNRVLRSTYDVDIFNLVQNFSLVTSLLASNNDTSCPGFTLSATCGNHICDNNEDASSCAADCASYGISSYNGAVTCNAIQSVYHPNSVSEVQSIVQTAVQDGLHIRASGAGHTTNDQICTDGIAIKTDKLTISNPNLTTAIEIFEGKEVVNVPAGTYVWDLSEWLA